MSVPSAVIGIGESAYSWKSGRSETGLALDAIRAALADAGLEARDMDGFARFSVDSVGQYEVAARLGIDVLGLSLDAAAGPASAVAMIAAASAAIAAGQVRAVVCYRAFNGRSMMRLGHLPVPPRGPDGHVLAGGGNPFLGEFHGPYGLAAPAGAFALWLRAYQHRHAIGDEKIIKALGGIVVRQRRYAGRNPRALLKDKPLDFEGYLASPTMAEPLRKADLCLESDGAAAFVIAGPELTAKSKSHPVYVLGTAASLSPDYDNFFFDLAELPPRFDGAMLPNLLRRNGLSHDDVDTVAIYDAASPNVLFDIENMGFCKPGEAVERVAEPRPAVNTSGGQLAEVYLQGISHVLELVRQLRGQSCNQVKGATVGVLSVAASQAVALFSNERAS